MMNLREVHLALRGRGALVEVAGGKQVAEALEAMSMPATVRRMRCVTTPEGAAVAQTLQLAYGLKADARSLLSIARKFARERDIWKEFQGAALLDASTAILREIYKTLWA
jgi:sugar (pentulose or hexulose) kinase